MIEQTSFLGIPLRTRGQRRFLVVLYFVLLLLLLVATMHWHRIFALMMAAQTMTLGGLLGGIKAGGPVKPFTRPAFGTESGPGDDTQTLNLSGRNRSGWTPLDERERGARDHAHYVAYRVLRWLVGGAALLYIGLMTAAPEWLADSTPPLLWLLLILVLSLPQVVILWTESPLAEDDSDGSAARSSV